MTYFVNVYADGKLGTEWEGRAEADRACRAISQNRIGVWRITLKEKGRRKLRFARSQFAL